MISYEWSTNKNFNENGELHNPTFKFVSCQKAFHYKNTKCIRFILEASETFLGKRVEIKYGKFQFLAKEQMQSRERNPNVVKLYV